MPQDDPVYCEMQDLVWSKEFRAAAVAAVEQGQPALAAIDPMLQDAMGPRYRIEGQGRENAGSLVAEIMRAAGYEKTGKSKNLPPNCLAGTGAMWRKKQSLK